MVAVTPNEKVAPSTLTPYATTTNSRVRVTVTAEIATFHVPRKNATQKLLPCFYGAPNPEVNLTGSDFDASRGYELLRNINLVANPSELTAIIGPSGCGKTTLMNILSQRAKGEVSGTVTYNNVVATRRNLKGCMSMCYASERLLPYLSVEETLFFATILKMGQASARERKERVNEVIADMALEHVRHTRIGGVWGKGLSSGEVRRTAIAVELIGDPAVLLLDEPTSGLDAVLAFEVMYVLKSLASHNRTIICSIHQPRVAIFDMFDSLLLMSKGRALYHGPAKAARDWFSEKGGINIPRRINTADALIDIASTSSKLGGKSALEIAEIYDKSEQLEEVRNQIQEARAIKSPAIRLADRHRLAQWFVEVTAVAFRTFRNSMRNPLSFSLVLVIQALMGCFLGAIFYKLPSLYLPEETPVYAGDADSPLMKMFDNSVIGFINTGIDGTGYNPWIEMLTNGVDGNQSEPFVELSAREVDRILYNSLPCVHEQLELEECYPESEFKDYEDLWGAPVGNELWAGGSESTPIVLTSYILKNLQVFDYVLGKFFFDDIISTFEATNGLFLMLTTPCHSQVREIAYTFSGCSGVPTLPTFDKTQRSLAFNFCVTIGAAGLGRLREGEDRGPIPTCGLANRQSAPVSQYSSKSSPALQGGGLESSSRNRGIKGNADPAATRRLQAGAIVGGNSPEMFNALPPILRQIIDRLSIYEESFTTCNHKLCRLLKAEEQDGSGSALYSVRTAFDSLGDYGAVLEAVMNIIGALFFSIANMGFASYDALVSIPQERSMVNREMANHLYKPSSYFIGKTLADMTFQLIPALLLVTTFYFLIGVEIGDNGYFYWRYLGICALTVFAAYGFAYFVSAASPTMEVAVVAAPIVMVIFICCSGFFVRDAAMPVWMSWVKYLSFYRWGFFGLIVNQFPPGGTYSGLPNSFSLAMAGIGETRIYVCCLSLLALGIGFRFLAYLSLKFMYRTTGIEQ